MGEEWTGKGKLAGSKLLSVRFADVHGPVGDGEDEKAQREDYQRDLVQPAALGAGVHQGHVRHVPEAVNTRSELG